jgi:hypothetical protein
MALSADDHISKMVDNIGEDWLAIAKIFVLLEKSKWLSKLEQSGLVSIKSFTWNKLTYYYGPNRSARADIVFAIPEKSYKIYFGKLCVCSNAFNCLWLYPRILIIQRLVKEHNKNKKIFYKCFFRWSRVLQPSHPPPTSAPSISQLRQTPSIRIPCEAP